MAPQTLQYSSSRETTHCHVLDDTLISYKNPMNRSQTGLRFHIDQTVLANLQIPVSEFVAPSVETFQKFVFVTSASSNHFNESKDLIASIQNYFPGKHIYYYDLGLSRDQIHEIKQFCQTEYRRFIFDSYPGHLRDLLTYTWKPVIIQQALAEFGAVFYVDSSVRLTTGDLTQVYEQLSENGGMLMFRNNLDYIYETTWPTMYSYLPTDASKRTSTRTYKAGFIFMSRTREVYANIMHWWVLCALEEWCMAPKLDKEMCTTSKMNKDARQGVFGHCHRYDQSAINILAANHYGYKQTRYSARTPVGSVQRKNTNQFDLKICR